MVNEFLRDFPEKIKTIYVYSYDFTGDNQTEIILGKRYVDDHTDEVITYNYVYDQTGNELFHFMGYLEYTEVYAEEDSESFYIQTSMHWEIHSDSIIYYKITKQVDQYLQLYEHLEGINVEKENLGYIYSPHESTEVIFEIEG